MKVAAGFSLTPKLIAWISSFASFKGVQGTYRVAFVPTAVVVVFLALGFVSAISAQQDDAVYRPGNGVSTPRLVKDVKPQYTADAFKRRVNGAVHLRCIVDRNGVPTQLEVIKALDAELDQVSLEALKQWRFEPGQKDGNPVRVQIDVQMAFMTDTKKSAPTPKKSLWDSYHLRRHNRWQ
jgi:TonB family protein